MTKPQKNLLRVAKAAIYLAPVLLVVWLAAKDLVYSGRLSASYAFGELSPFVSTLRPQDRVADPAVQPDGSAVQAVTDEPVYFDVRTPRWFDGIDVTLRYRHPAGRPPQPVIQLGALVDRGRWLFDLKPVENRAIEQLLADRLRWSHVRNGSTVLFQQSDDYLSIEEFLQSPPPRDQVALYEHPWSQPFRLPGYEPAPADAPPRVRATSLRGSHRMITYVRDEPLSFSFVIHDTNRNADEDFFDLKVSTLDGEVVHTQFLADDGVVEGGAAYGAPRTVDLHVPGLAEGAYRVEFTTSDDVFVRQLATRQSRLAFIDRVYLGDAVGYSDELDAERTSATRLVSDGRRFGAFTSHLEGLQALRFGDEVLPISQTHRRYDLALPERAGADLRPVVAPRNDVRLTTRGLWAFSADEYFNPFLRDLADGQPVDPDRIRYVLARYRQPEVGPDGWRTATVSFRGGAYDQAGGTLPFVVGLPYLADAGAGDEARAGIELASIDVELTRERLTPQKLVRKLLQAVGIGS